MDFKMQLQKGKFDSVIYNSMANTLLLGYIGLIALECFLYWQVAAKELPWVVLIFPVLSILLVWYGGAWVLLRITGYSQDDMKCILEDQCLPKMTVHELGMFLARYWHAFSDDLVDCKVTLVGKVSGKNVEDKDVHCFLDTAIDSDVGVIGRVEQVSFKNNGFIVNLRDCRRSV